MMIAFAPRPTMQAEDESFPRGLRTSLRGGNVAEYEDRLRSLALNDERFVESVLAMEVDDVEVSRLDPKTHALVRLGALLAIDAAPASYQWSVDAALAAGATVDEVVGTLVAIAPTVGLTRVVSAAPDVAVALGYDIDAEGVLAERRSR
jgi:4-carboxymuconolactone decarboxylase